MDFFWLRNYLKAALVELLWCPTKSFTEELGSDRDTAARLSPLWFGKYSNYSQPFISAQRWRAIKILILKGCKKLFQRKNKSLDKALHDIGQSIKLGEPMRSIKQQMLSQNSNHSPWEG